MILDIIFSIFLYVYLANKWRRERLVRFTSKTLFYIYMVVVAYLTLMPVISSIPHIFNHTYSYNFELFRDIKYGYGDFAKQIIYNVLMTIPMGMFLKYIYRKNYFETMRTSILIIFTIEVLQPILHGYRVCDITDIFTNTCGAMIGYLIMKIMLLVWSTARDKGE